MLDESTSYRPFKYQFLMEAAKRHSIDMYWDVHSVELQDDIRQYNNLKTPNVSHEVNKYILDTLINLFTEMDRAVADGYIKLLPYAKNNEARCWLLTAAQREVVHQRGYALLPEALGFSNARWVDFKNHEQMQNKLNAVKEDIDTNCSEALQAAKILSTVLLGEGIGLFAAFTCLLNFKRYGLLMGYNDVNQWSLADEQDHVETNIKLLHTIPLTYDERAELTNHILDKAAELTKAEFDYIDLICAKGDPEGLTKLQLRDYIGFLNSYRLGQLGLSDHSLTNPLPWMDWLLSAKKHDAFFEKRVTDYVHTYLPGKVDYSKYI